MQEGWDVSSSDSHPCWAVIRCMTGFQTIIIINDRYDHVVEDEDPYDYQFPYGRHHRCRIKKKKLPEMTLSNNDIQHSGMLIIATI